MSKHTYEGEFPEGEAGVEDKIIRDALAQANAKFFEVLQQNGLQKIGSDVEGSYDRGGCGHDRSK